METRFETAGEAVLHMGAGWNLGNTLDSNSGSLDNMWIEAWSARTPKDYETAWGQPQATRELIHMFKVAARTAGHLRGRIQLHSVKIGNLELFVVTGETSQDELGQQNKGE